MKTKLHLRLAKAVAFAAILGTCLTACTKEEDIRPALMTPIADEAVLETGDAQARLGVTPKNILLGRGSEVRAEDDGSNIADRKRPAIKTNSRIFDLGVATTDYRADAGKFTGHANYGLTGCEKTDKCFVEGAGGDVINTTGDALDFRPDRRIIKMKGVGIN